MVEKKEEKKMIDPKDNQLHISGYRDVRSFVFLSKIYMKKFEDIELHALGDAISTCVRVSDQLQKFDYAKITKIQTFAQVPESKDQTQGKTPEEDQNQRKKIKMIITLKRATNFMEKTSNIK